MLKQILDLKIGTKQSSGVMSVYPLIGENRTDALASFEDIKFEGTSMYGEMDFSNKNTDKPFIIPTGYSIMTKQEAQDHAIPFATLLNSNSFRTVRTACCIQQTQCGLINGNNLKEYFSILPLYIRKRHFEDYLEIKNNRMVFEGFNFSRLWNIISDFQGNIVKDTEGNMILFFNKFMDKLAQFNAEFEIVEGQIGAVIMLNNKIIGIEIAPTHEYWKSIWDSLIRDCYGSEVIRLTMNNLINVFNESKELELNLDDCLTINEIEDKIEIYNESNENHLIELLKSISINDILKYDSDNLLTRENSNKEFFYSLFKIKNKKQYGEAYTDQNGKLVYLSMLL